jgi:fructose-1,6-bisphosphatase/inositol monophosphatase family enzyme
MIDDIKDALVSFGFSANMKAINGYYEKWKYLFDNCKKGIPWICPALSICNVARGRIEAFIDKGCSFEGQAAASLILKNAGGKMINYDWSAYEVTSKGGIFTNGKIKYEPD